MLLRSWILCCAVLVAFGWIISPFGGIVPLSYEIVLGLLATWAVLYGVWGKASPFRSRRFIPARLTSVKLFLPGVFAISAILLFIKGVATPPCHDDGLVYRIPRTMHWIMDHRWHWISSVDPRYDVLGTVSEWLSVPFLLLFKTDRLIFLPNWISHLFLPGLIFSVWRGFGVSPKIAWLSMWLVPTGFCFALQAVNTSNDSIAAFFLLAAFYFALKGHRSQSWGDFAFAVLCVSLASGVKLNLISLLPAWLIAMGFGWRIFFSRFLAASLILCWGALISFVPTGIFNWIHGRSWTGLAYVVPTPPGDNFLGTTYLILTQNLMPPLVALSNWGYPLLVRFQHLLMGDLLLRYFHQAGPIYYTQIAIEQAGIGFIVFTLLGLMFGLTKKTRFFSPGSLTPWKQSLIFIWVVVAFLHYLFFVNSDQPARLICPFYLLLTPFLFAGRSFRNPAYWPAFRVLTATALLVGVYIALCLTENPLFPIVPQFQERGEKLETARLEIDQAIPTGEKNVGIIRFWFQRESWLWQPYGSRKVIEFPFQPDPQEAQYLGISYLAISDRVLYENHTTIEAWLAGRPWTLVRSTFIGEGKLVDDGWYLVKRVPMKKYQPPTTESHS